MDYLFPVFLLSLVVVGVLDLKKHFVPNIITLPLLAAGLIMGAIQGMNYFMASLAAAAVLFLIGYVAYSMGGMGGGDVKLLAAIGAWMGLSVSFDVFLLASVIGAVWGLAKYASAGMLKEKLTLFFRGVYLKLICRVKGDVGWQKLPEDITAPVPKEALPFGTCLAASVIFITLREWYLQ